MSLERGPKLPEDNPGKRRFDRTSFLMFIGVCVLFIASRLWHLTASCLWFDEIFSVHAARHDWSSMRRFVAADIIHPPLFYSLLKLWIAIGGESLLWLRLFPVLFGIAVIVPVFFLCRQLRLSFGQTTLALLLLTVNGSLIRYSQEVRMYSMLLFFSACSLFLFFKYVSSVNSRHAVIALSVANLLLVYTHYFGWIVVLFELAIVLWMHREKLVSFVAGVIGIVVAFIPWIYEVAAMRENNGGLQQNIGWMTRPHVLNLVQYFTSLNQPFFFTQSSADAPYNPWSAGAALLLIGVPLIAFVLAGFREDKMSNDIRALQLRSMFVFAAGPVILVFVMAWFLPWSIWGERHLIFIAVPWSILAALAISRIRTEWVKITIALVLGLWFLLAGTLLILQRVDRFIWCTWEPLATQAIQKSDGGQPVSIYAYEDLIAYHLWFALSANGANTFSVNVIKGAPGMTEDPAYFLPRRFDEVKVQRDPLPLEDHIWVAFRALKWNEAAPPLDSLTAAGFQIKQVLREEAQGQQAFLVELSRTP
jgi:4-amino-4-deoxy-L-arabinose transferase-like glycosyltransferase